MIKRPKLESLIEDLDSQVMDSERDGRWLSNMSLILPKLEFSTHKIIVTYQQSQVLVPYFSTNIWICLQVH